MADSISLVDGWGRSNISLFLPGRRQEPQGFAVT
jgi:hypothetical protein